MYFLFSSLYVLLLLVLPLQASEPTTEPVLRVETGMHSALIRRIVVDEKNNRLVTCSDDKTIRIWQLPEKRLVRTLRVPIDQGHEGQLFGLAVSPDGKTIAAGGWTGWDWDKKASVYIFDVDSGELVKRLTDFRDAIHALAWSPDGKFLAVGLQGRAGLDFVRLSDGKTISSDTQYLDKLTDLSYAKNGRLLAISMDGMARLYNQKFKLIGRKKIPGGKTPIAIKYSPDSKSFAVGFLDKPVISVFSANKMEYLLQFDLTDINAQVNLTTVAWGETSEFLYAAGDFRGKDNSIYRWNINDKNAMDSITVSNLRVSEIQEMSGGHIAFSTEDPGFGILKPDGKILTYQKSDVIDHSDIGSQFKISNDALLVSYPEEGDENENFIFSALSAGDQSLRQKVDDELFPPIRDSNKFKIENWKDSYELTVNGIKPLMDDYEISRSYAFSPDDEKVLLGTEWAIRLLDKDAKEIWHQKLAAVAWGVNISRNGKLAVAALSDGTIRWYQMKDGKEVLAYFPLSNGCLLYTSPSPRDS